MVSLMVSFTVEFMKKTMMFVIKKGYGLYFGYKIGR
jgi:hypothetical protein